MIGNITQPESVPVSKPNANIYIMDIRNYTWVNSFELSNTEPIPTNVTNISGKSHQSNNKMRIVISLVGGFIGAAITIICGFLFYRWNNKRKE